ncbi:MAG: VWA domain-containing protein [Candidatus Limnocylindrales bacterium]
MDRRLVAFITDLRASGVRISLAESQDAARGLVHLPTLPRETFRAALQTTLVKDHTDDPIFDKLFSLHFSATPKFRSPEDVLSPDEQRMLEEALRATATNSNPNRLLRQLASAKNPTYTEVNLRAQQARRTPMGMILERFGVTRAAHRRMGLGQMEAEVDLLTQNLAAQGMDPTGMEDVQRLVSYNEVVLTEMVGTFAGQNPGLPQSAVSSSGDLDPSLLNTSVWTDLLVRTFAGLSEAEAHALRWEVRRLGRKLRARAALRQKRGAGKALDAKTTLRASLRAGGVPFRLYHRKKHLKPKFVLICDVSGSMGTAAEFMLRLMFEMQEQTTKLRSFAFKDHIQDVTDEFVRLHPDRTVLQILERFPFPYYSDTDLGRSLAEFCEHFIDVVDRHTVLVFLGDARNNGNDPRLDLFDRIGRRARQVVWFNPAPREQWGKGDSDMLRYAPLCTTVHQISNLAQLTEAVDGLFMPG